MPADACRGRVRAHRPMRAGANSEGGRGVVPQHVWYGARSCMPTRGGCSAARVVRCASVRAGARLHRRGCCLAVSMQVGRSRSGPKLSTSGPVGAVPCAQEAARHPLPARVGLCGQAVREPVPPDVQAGELRSPREPACVRQQSRHALSGRHLVGVLGPSMCNALCSAAAGDFALGHVPTRGRFCCPAGGAGV